MAKKSYTVVGTAETLGHKPGETFSADLTADQESFYIDGGHLAVGTDQEAPDKVPCPACVEQGLARPPKFDDPSKLEKHYADKHPALVAPDSLPEPAGKEE